MGVSVTSRPLQVLVDGGSRLGLMILADGKLAALLVPVEVAEDGGHHGPGGWYLEAGFGPCSALSVLPPAWFETEAVALEWVAGRVK